MYLFTDASVEPKMKIGFGAYLLIADLELAALTLDATKLLVKTKKFEFTSSTRLELETLLWALQDSGCQSMHSKLTVYTDSQNIVALPKRQERLENMKFQSKNSGTELVHAALYRRFYTALDQFRFELIKVAGHTRMTEKNHVLRLFSCVDKASRKALRDYLT